MFREANRTSLTWVLKKQAAARAAYCEAKLVVLDDIFSALDRKTAIAVLYQLCGDNGILRQAGATVVISTYLRTCSLLT